MTIYRRSREQSYHVAMIIKMWPNLTTRELANKCGIDYYNTFNKRAARFYRKLQRWVYRQPHGKTYRWLIRPEFVKMSMHEFKKLIAAS